MLLHIVRHGQTDWNVERRIQGQLESELNETGLEQARQRGKDLINIPFAAIYSSSSLRTRQTTQQLLSNRLNDGLVDGKTPVVYMDDLREVCMGVWQGQLWSEVAAAYPAMVEAHRKGSSDFVVEGAESMAQLQDRGVKAIEKIITDLYDSKTISDSDEILIVSHGAIMKTMLAYYLNIPLTELHTKPTLPNCAHCLIDVQGTERAIIQIAGAPVEQWKRQE